MYKGIRLTDYAISVLRSSKTHREVAVELETHPFNVYKERKRLGIKSDLHMPRNVQRKNRQLVMSVTVIQMLNSCMTTASIARTLSFSENCIRRHRQKLKIASVEWPKMNDEKIEQLRQSTLKSREIARVLGISKRTVNVYRRKFKDDMVKA